VPEDKEIIRPTPCYVVKFKHTKCQVRDDKIKKGEVYEKEVRAGVAKRSEGTATHCLPT